MRKSKSGSHKGARKGQHRPGRNDRAKGQNRDHNQDQERDASSRKGGTRPGSKKQGGRPQQGGKPSGFRPPQGGRPQPGARKFEIPRAGSAAGQTIEGRVDLHPDGFGFLIAKDPALPNVYLPEDTLKNVMHRDEVTARILPPDNMGRSRGQVLSITKRSQRELLGLYRTHAGGAIVVPTETRDRKHAFKVVPGVDTPPDLKNGDCVLCAILTHPDKGMGTAQITGRIEDPKSASIDTLRVLMAAGWPRHFTRAALTEAEQRAGRWRPEMDEQMRRGRKDVRNVPLVTIDGRDARDFDDAVAAKVEGNAIRLWVAVADVSHFVVPGSVLDFEAFERCTSVYFPDYVVPMLPEVLSNGVCSLNPNEDRACMMCEMRVDATNGQIMDFTVYPALMRSQRRMTYEDMQSYIEDEPWAREALRELTPSLDALVKVFRVLHAAKNKRGAIDLDLAESKVMLNPDGTVRDIQSRERLDAHRLIEECMLAANECTAKLLREKLGQAMYRVHEPPDEKKAATLMKFLSLQGVDMSKVPDLQHPKDYQALLRLMKQEFPVGDARAQAAQFLVLSSLKQARYEPECFGHFALALKNYTHFTSPIRRYPDLVVHRLLKDVVGFQKAPQSQTTLPEQSRRSSDQERAAMDCERKVIDMKKCRYMEPKLGEEFEAWVSGVAEKGLFCQIDGHFVDGLISSEQLQKRLKAGFDKETLCYRGRDGKVYSHGLRVKVQLAAVDVETRRIDFELLQVY